MEYRIGGESQMFNSECSPVKGGGGIVRSLSSPQERFTAGASFKYCNGLVLTNAKVFVYLMGEQWPGTLIDWSKTFDPLRRIVTESSYLSKVAPYGGAAVGQGIHWDYRPFGDVLPNPVTQEDVTKFLINYAWKLRGGTIFDQQTMHMLLFPPGFAWHDGSVLGEHSYLQVF